MDRFSKVCSSFELGNVIVSREIRSYSWIQLSLVGGKSETKCENIIKILGDASAERGQSQSGLGSRESARLSRPEPQEKSRSDCDCDCDCGAGVLSVANTPEMMILHLRNSYQELNSFLLRVDSG
jgi:hypothetical protein